MAMATSTVAPDKQLRNKTIFSTLRPNFLGILVEDCGLDLETHNLLQVLGSLRDLAGNGWRWLEVG